MNEKYNPADDPILSLRDGELSAASLEEVASLLALDAPPVPPPPSLKQRALDRAFAGPSFVVVRKEEGEWYPLPFPGVSTKRLYTDPNTSMTSWLVRLEPGAKYPAHSHAEPEQCLVLEGHVRFGDMPFSAGDYMCSLRGSEHQVSTSDQGCLLLIINSPHDKLHI